MARISVDWRYPAAATERCASMVSELSIATTHGDIPGGDLTPWRSPLRSGHWSRSSHSWRSNPWDPGGDGNFNTNQNLKPQYESQLEGFRDRRSSIEGQFSLRPYSIHLRSRKGGFLGVEVKHIQESGPQSGDGHWQGAPIWVDNQTRSSVEGDGSRSCGNHGLGAQTQNDNQRTSLPGLCAGIDWVRPSSGHQRRNIRKSSFEVRLHIHNLVLFDEIPKDLISTPRIVGKLMSIFKRVKHKNSVDDYVECFVESVRLASEFVESVNYELDEEFLLVLFVIGLKPEIRYDVQDLEPKSLSEAVKCTRLQEKALILQREKEAIAQETKELLKCIKDYRLAAKSLLTSEREDMMFLCSEAEHWLGRKILHQKTLCNNVKWSYEISLTTQVLHSMCSKILKGMLKSKALVKVTEMADFEIESEAEEDDDALVGDMTDSESVGEEEEVVFDAMGMYQGVDNASRNPTLDPKPGDVNMIDNLVMIRGKSEKFELRETMRVQDKAKSILIGSRDKRTGKLLTGGQIRVNMNGSEDPTTCKDKTNAQSLPASADAAMSHVVSFVEGVATSETDISARFLLYVEITIHPRHLKQKKSLEDAIKMELFHQYSMLPEANLLVTILSATMLLRYELGKESVAFYTNHKLDIYKDSQNKPEPALHSRYHFTKEGLTFENIEEKKKGKEKVELNELLRLSYDPGGGACTVVFSDYNQHTEKCREDHRVMFEILNQIEELEASSRVAATRAKFENADEFELRARLISKTKDVCFDIIKPPFFVSLSPHDSNMVTVLDSATTSVYQLVGNANECLILDNEILKSYGTLKFLFTQCHEIRRGKKISEIFGTPYSAMRPVHKIENTNEHGVKAAIKAETEENMMGIRGDVVRNLFPTIPLNDKRLNNLKGHAGIVLNVHKATHMFDGGLEQSFMCHLPPLRPLPELPLQFMPFPYSKGMELHSIQFHCSTTLCEMIPVRELFNGSSCNNGLRRFWKLPPLKLLKEPKLDLEDKVDFKGRALM